MTKKERKEQERKQKIAEAEAKRLAEAKAQAPAQVVTVQPEIDKQQGGVTVVISSTVLGQKRAEYQRHREKGLTEDRILERMTEDANVFGVSIDQYKGLLVNLKSRTAKGENLDVLRHAHTDKLANASLSSLGFLNGLISTDVDSLNFPTLQKFVKDMKVSLIELVTLLQNTDITTKRGKQAWMIMLHSPVFNFISEQPTGTSLLSLFVGGWSDKSRDYDQYGIRQEASGAATFYRDISYEQPITVPENIEE